MLQHMSCCTAFVAVWLDLKLLRPAVCVRASWKLESCCLSVAIIV